MRLLARLRESTTRKLEQAPSGINLRAAFSQTRRGERIRRKRKTVALGRCGQDLSADASLGVEQTFSQTRRAHSTTTGGFGKASTSVSVDASSLARLRPSPCCGESGANQLFCRAQVCDPQHRVGTPPEMRWLRNASAGSLYKLPRKNSFQVHPSIGLSS